MTQYFFVDESGEPGFHSRHASKYFVLAMVQTPSWTPIEQLAELRRYLHLQPTFQFHYTKMSPPQRHALTPLEDFNERFGTGFAHGEIDTIGGIVMARLGRVPRRGERLELDGWRFEALRPDSRRLHLMKVTRLDGSAAPGD